MRMLATTFAVLVGLSPPAFAATPTLATVSASLDGQPQCVTFAWEPGNKGAERGAITVPVTINGRALRLQLDTGADATILYDKLADAAEWSRPVDEKFQAHGFSIGSTQLDRSEVHVLRDMKDDGRVSGTLGLAELIGHVAIIDYPGKRFCLFAPADIPAPLA